MKDFTLKQLIDMQLTPVISCPYLSFACLGSEAGLGSFDPQDGHGIIQEGLHSVKDGVICDAKKGIPRSGDDI